MLKQFPQGIRERFFHIFVPAKTIHPKNPDGSLKFVPSCDKIVLDTAQMS